MPSRLGERAAGRWSGLLPSFGVDGRFLTNRQGPCPMCEGKTRFRFDDKEGRGTWICNHCGAGDGADLAQRVSGLDFRDVAERIEAMLGSVEPKPQPPERSAEDCRRALNRLWRLSKPVRPEDPVGLYLRNRVGLTSAPGCLRTVRNLFYRDDKPSRHPAMIAMVSAVDGSAATLHRTYLTEDGRKADVPEPRRLMPGCVAPGTAIRLFDPEPTLGIAEGIETALSAASLFGLPVWAAISSSMLAKWEPPEGTREVVVFGDADAGYGGQAAAYALAHRLARQDLAVRVELPPALGSDWNDVLNAQAEPASAEDRHGPHPASGSITEGN